MSKSFLLAAVCTSVIGASLTTPGHAMKYAITDLGTLGGTSSGATDVNNQRQVVGYSTYEAGVRDRHAFLWENGVMFDLGTLGGPHSSAYSINSAGQITGSADFHPCLWDNGTITDLGLNGGSSGTAFSINDNGHIALTISSLDRMRNDNYRWIDGGMTFLGTLGGDGYDRVGAINSYGQIVGVSNTGTVRSDHAFIWENGIMTDLGTLGGDYSVATGINDSGVIAGYSAISVGGRRPVYWASGVINELQTLGSQGQANAINEAGIIVGSTAADAVFWMNESIFNLNDLIYENPKWLLQSARGINNQGDIVGTGLVDLDGDGSFDEQHAFLLTPIISPTILEAESMALSNGYAVEVNAAASGGQLIRRLDSGGRPATASTRYAGHAGNYDILVWYFDESDGMSSLAFLLNGEMLDQWIADEELACRDCASPGASTMRARVVARNVHLAPGDEITLQGTGDYYEYARFDKVTVAPVSSTTFEAEMMTLEGGYQVEANPVASGGQLIRRLESGGYAATASTEFAGLAGSYDITVSYFDESDGISSLAFLLNGEMLDQWVADEDPSCRDCASPGESTLRARLVAKELRLVPGDVIALQGTGEHYEYARFDKITLAPVGFHTLEAERMILDDGFVVEANAAASDGQLIRGNGPAGSIPGEASAPFMGTKGQYDITVAYFDEYDGISSMAVFLNDQLVDHWLADENPACAECASPNERTLRSRVVARGIEISPGDEIRLESTVNQYEYGRFDKIDFTRTLSP